MLTIPVRSSKKYDVLIGEDLLRRAGELILSVISGGTAFIISDDNVYPLYGAELVQSLSKAGFQTESFVFPHGEGSKSLKNYGQILEEMCAKHITRSDFVIALGGGVVGDLAGFAAATYQRGIRFVQIPTTLLAAVDSSVGGKTAIDLPNGKNQVGCFYQPTLVLCDTDTLRTLPETEYRNGCAEIIKYAVIGDAELFERILAEPVCLQYGDVISRCVAMKGEIVEEDEFDLGRRMLLNFGHTLGHAVESCSGFSVPHGQAVAIGMAAIARAASKHGICAEETNTKLEAILKMYQLPSELPYPAERIAEAVMTDKKRSGGQITLILPEYIGKCKMEKVPKENILQWVKDGD